MGCSLLINSKERFETERETHCPTEITPRCSWSLVVLNSFNTLRYRSLWTQRISEICILFFSNFVWPGKKVGVPTKGHNLRALPVDIRFDSVRLPRKCDKRKSSIRLYSNYNSISFYFTVIIRVTTATSCHDLLWFRIVLT